MPPLHPIRWQVLLWICPINCRNIINRKYLQSLFNHKMMLRFKWWQQTHHKIGLLVLVQTEHSFLVSPFPLQVLGTPNSAWCLLSLCRLDRTGECQYWLCDSLCCPCLGDIKQPITMILTELKKQQHDDFPFGFFAISILHFMPRKPQNCTVRQFATH